MYLSMATGFISIAAGLQKVGAWQASLSLLASIMLLFVLAWRGFRATCGLALVITIFAAAAGLWRGMPLVYAVGGVIGGLAAWDLEGFLIRLTLATQEDNPLHIERTHLTRLAVILLLGGGISTATQGININFNFETAAVLAIFSFAGIGTLINWLRNKEK